MEDNVSRLEIEKLPDGSRRVQIIIPGGLDTGTVRDEPEPQNDKNPATD